MLSIGLLAAFYGKLIVRLAVPTLRQELAKEIVTPEALRLALEKEAAERRRVEDSLTAHKSICDNCRTGMDAKIATVAAETFSQQWGPRDLVLQERFRSMQEYLDSQNMAILAIRGTLTTIGESVAFIRGAMESHGKRTA